MSLAEIALPVWTILNIVLVAACVYINSTSAGKAESVDSKKFQPAIHHLEKAPKQNQAKQQ